MAEKNRNGGGGRGVPFFTRAATGNAARRREGGPRWERRGLQRTERDDQLLPPQRSDCRSKERRSRAPCVRSCMRPLLNVRARDLAPWLRGLGRKPSCCPAPFLHLEIMQNTNPSPVEGASSSGTSSIGSSRNGSFNSGLDSFSSGAAPPPETDFSNLSKLHPFPKDTLLDNPLSKVLQIRSSVGAHISKTGSFENLQAFPPLLRPTMALQPLPSSRE